MNVPALLLRLYPPGIRERWGSEIVHEARLAGPRSWFDTAAGAAKLWLHPSDWPETANEQTSRVLTTAFVAVTVVATLLVRAAGPASLTANLGRPTTSAWFAPVLAGLALAAPLPPPHWATLGRLVVAAAHSLIAPVLAFGTLFLIAHSGLIVHPTGVAKVLLVGSYWAVLSFIAIHLCLLTARVGRFAVLPSTRRLRLALLLLGAGLALAAVQTLLTGTLVLSCGLAALAAAVFAAGLDLRRIAE
ncbi:hypothetical protein [Amycolatopsis benzoatilytica]|uniref:hypothetical protein n=1 Tax=Amycolatopsis benzoatilytica TaxID=346045 RepID=UPI00036A98C3|nr:hypothetical protein [Amycolatopsis benzoatilytica]